MECVQRYFSQDDDKAQLRVLAYISSQIKRTISMVKQIEEVELLRGIDIQELGLQALLVVDLRRLGISNVFELINCDRNCLLDNALIGPSGICGIVTQLDTFGLTLPD
jgi:hypothetical protein